MDYFKVIVPAGGDKDDITNGDVELAVSVSQVKALIQDGNSFFLVMEDGGVMPTKGIRNINNVYAMLICNNFFKYKTIGSDVENYDVEHFIWFNKDALIYFDTNIEGDLIHEDKHHIRVSVGPIAVSVVENKEKFFTQNKIEISNNSQEVKKWTPDLENLKDAKPLSIGGE